MANSRKLGKAREQAACVFLQKQGLKLIRANYYCKFGEIDIIMKDREALAFIEVRSRTCLHFGRAHETVTKAKQRKIISASKTFLAENRKLNFATVRFDVVGMDGDFNINWIKNAFLSE